MDLSPAKQLAKAVALVRGNPSGVAQIDAAAQRQRDAAAAEARRLTDAQAQVDKRLPERTQAVADDFGAVWSAAIWSAAEDCARLQLKAEGGAIEPKTLAYTAIPMRLDFDTVLRHFRKLARERGLPWRKGHLPAVVMSALRQEAVKSAGVVDPQQAIEAQKRKLAEDAARRERGRQAMSADRKAADADLMARVGGGPKKAP